jgi:hypothetical protein
MKRQSIQVVAAPKWNLLADTGGAYVVEMDAQAWLDLPGHPRRRDTKRQSQKAHWDRARRASDATKESLRWVVAAEYDGKVWKVQGHARGLLWQNGGLERPATVFATVYRCRSWESLLELYSSYDSKDAAETALDKVYGAYRQHGLTLTSKRLRYGMIAEALWLAMRGVASKSETGAASGLEELDVYEAVGMFREELLMLDSVNPDPDVFQTGVVAAALLGLAVEPTGLPFFGALARNEGSKRGHLLDPVEASRAHIESVKKSKSSWVKAQHEDLCGRILRAYFTWRLGETTTNYWAASIDGAENVPAIVREVKAKKNIPDSHPAS